MNFGISNLSICPIKKEASHSSEMISQILFGEHFNVLEKGETWSLIRLFHDKYIGWIHNNQYIGITKYSFDQLNESPFLINYGISTLILNYKHKILIPSGSRLLKPNSFKIGPNEYKIETKNIFKTPLNLDIIDIAMSYLNSPYLWGGRTNFGIDCSGFVQSVFRFKGIDMARDSQDQGEIGVKVDMIEKGNLLFFSDIDNEKSKINHVAIAIDKDNVIHSNGCVKIDKLQSILKKRKLISIKKIKS